MFGVDSGELFLIVLVAVVVIGPKDLPRVMRSIGHWVGKARGMANQFRSGVDQMLRESEVADLEKKWREQNQAIMSGKPVSDWGIPTPAPRPPPIAEPVSLAKNDASADIPTPPATRRPPPPAPALVKPAGTPARAAPDAEAS